MNMNENNNNKFTVQGNSTRVPSYAADAGSKRPITNPSDDKTFKNLYEDTEGHAEAADNTEATAKASAITPKATAKNGSQLRSPFDLSYSGSAAAKKPVVEESFDAQVAMVDEPSVPDVQQPVAYSTPQTARFNQQRHSQDNFSGNTPSHQFAAEPSVIATEQAPQQNPTPKSPTVWLNSEHTASLQTEHGQALVNKEPLVGKQQEPTAVHLVNKDQAPIVNSLVNKDKEPLPSPFSMAAEASRSKMRPDNLLGNAVTGKMQVDNTASEDSANLSIGAVRKENVATARFTHEPMDMAEVNPGAIVAPTSIQTHSSVAAESAQPVVRVNLHEIYQQLVKNLAEVRDSGKTETIITLGSNTGVFQGARIVVTDFDAAKGHLNIVFENLDVRAQRLLEMPQHQTRLIETLSRDGYFVQQFTTTTYNEPRLTIASGHLQGEQQQRNPQEQEDQAANHRRGQRDQA